MKTLLGLNFHFSIWWMSSCSSMRTGRTSTLYLLWMACCFYFLSGMTWPGTERAKEHPHPFGSGNCCCTLARVCWHSSQCGTDTILYSLGPFRLPLSLQHLFRLTKKTPKRCYFPKPLLWCKAAGMIAASNGLIWASWWKGLRLVTAHTLPLSLVSLHWVSVWWLCSSPKGAAGGWNVSCQQGKE